MNKVYDIITDKIIQELGKGNIIWRKTWRTSQPKNLITKKDYRGLNVWLLNMQGFTSPYWLTFKQVNKLKGRVKQGEHSTIITYWQVKEYQKPNPIGEIETFERLVLRYYRVFNTEQCEGLKLPVDNKPTIEPLQECENILEKYKTKPSIINKDNNRAFYSPSKDYINIPDKNRFINSESYYATLFHELAHSTGHKSRLDRQGVATTASFGSADYSKEELVAEFSASFLCGVARIENTTIQNQSAYIQNWIKALQNDKRLLFTASSKAQQVTDYMLGVTN